jgi:hypothetical protein
MGRSKRAWIEDREEFPPLSLPVRAPTGKGFLSIERWSRAGRILSAGFSRRA